MAFMEGGNFRNKDGTLKPGHNGLKPRGANNRLQHEIKNKITDFLNGKLETIEEIYSQVSPKEKLKFLLELLGYILPKSKEIFLDNSEENRASIDYSKLPEDVLRQILNATTLENEIDGKVL